MLTKIRLQKRLYGIEPFFLTFPVFRIYSYKIFLIFKVASLTLKILKPNSTFKQSYLKSSRCNSLKSHSLWVTLYIKKRGNALTLAIFFALKSAKSSQIIINIFQQMQFETFCSLNICNLCLYSGAKNIKLRLPIISNSSRRFKLRKPDYMQLFKYILDESKCQHFFSRLFQSSQLQL